MTPSLTREDRSRQQIAATIGVIREVLGDATVAVYLYGSAVTGGLRADSDLDVLVIRERSLSDAERTAMIQRLLPISGRRAAGGPARSLELSIVAWSALSPWRYPPSIEFQFGEWMRSKLEQGELPEWPHPDSDVAILVETAFRAAVPLLGPPIAAILDPIPRADLYHAMVIRFRSLCQGSRTEMIAGTGCLRLPGSG